MEVLQEVRSLGNVNNITTLELITDKTTHKIRIPYTVKNLLGDSNIYNYSIGVKDFCKIKNIYYRDYFKLIHKDCD